jgi:glyoxylase-like metal-dependent hydrolase (beta-lactamase superfamily II)
LNATWAALPGPGSNGVRVQQRTLGDFQLTHFTDGNYFLDGGAFFGIVPKVLWQRKLQADASNRISAAMNSLLVRTGRHTVLIETGMGNKLPEKVARIYAQPAGLLDNLSAGGIRADEIDVVINTHLHFDHCGWNTVRTDDGVTATFPNAKYYVQEGEWRYAGEQRERDRVSYLSDNYDPLVRSGQMQLLRGDAKIVPGISVQVFPGHTRHMQAVLVRSGGETACYISDLIPTAAHLDLTWVMAFDLFPLETIESRKAFYKAAIAENWLVAFTHDPNLPWTHLEMREGKVVPRQL